MRALLCLLVFFALSSFTDKPELERVALIGELNMARANPEAYGCALNIDLSEFKPAGALVLDKRMNRHAQDYADALVKKINLVHSQMGYYESILWCYDLDNAVKQFIIDEDVPDLSHRIHLLNGNHTRAGIGVSTGWVGRWERTYVVILTR